MTDKTREGPSPRPRIPCLILLVMAIGSTIFFGLPVMRMVAVDWKDIPTGSMMPSVLKGDHILVNKSIYGPRIPFTRRRIWQGKDPSRGDIVVFISPGDEKMLLKRIVGLPGEVVEIRDNDLFINDTEATHLEPDPKIVERTDKSMRDAFYFAIESIGEAKYHIAIEADIPPAPYGPREVPAGHYFVLGDNRSNSRDSRWFGEVARSSILGKATHLILPVAPKEHGPPRSERFLEPVQ